MSEPMYHYVVYDHPLDYPDHFVVRRFAVLPDGPVPEKEIHMQNDSLDEIRHYLFTLGLFPIGRDKHDDPVIVETWI